MQNTLRDFIDELDRAGELTRANAGLAPIERAMWRLGSGGLAEFARDRPFEIGDAEPIPEDALSLSEHLRVRVSQTADQAIRTGWARFSEGAYRAALRAFEAAGDLRRGDVESAQAAILCHLMLDSQRAAAVALRQLARQPVNPFLTRLELDDRLPEDASLESALVSVRRFAESSAGVPEIVALNAYVTWLTGGRAEAIRIARTLPAIAPDSAFADWPENMEQAGQAFELTGD